MVAIKLNFLHFYNYICDELVNFHFSFLWKFKRTNNKSFHHILLLFPDDISLNPGPIYNSQSSCSNEWKVFLAKGINLIHLNVNSLLPKIDEIRCITAHINAAVIYLNLSLTKLFFSRKSKYQTMTCSDWGVASEGNQKYFCWNSFA